MMDRMIDQQNKLLASLGPLVSECGKDLAVAFAEYHNLTLVSYDPRNAEWRMSDGDIYSMSLIERESAYALGV